MILSGNRMLIGSAAGKARADSDAGDIDLTVFDVERGVGEVVKLRERFQPDDHDAPSFLTLPDGRLLAGYQSHPAAEMSGQNLMRWRVSVNPGDPFAWQEEQNLDVDGPVSYCHLIRMPAENDRIYNFFRGPDSRPHYLVSDDGGVNFRHAGKLLSWDFDPKNPRYSGRDGYRPYVKYIAGADDTIHLVASEDHPRAWPNSMYHAILRGGRILHSNGEDLGPMGTGTDAPVRVDALTRIFQGDEDNIAWPMDMHVDAQGYPIILFSVRTGDRVHRLRARSGGEDHRYHYARWDGERWKVVELCYGGSCLYLDEEDFSGLAAVDPDRPDVVFVSTNADPVTGAPLISARDGRRHFEIYRGNSPDGGETWRWTALTADSVEDNIRPTVPIWPGERRAVLWMRGPYTTFTNYDTDIVGFIEQR